MTDQTTIGIATADSTLTESLQAVLAGRGVRLVRAADLDSLRSMRASSPAALWIVDVAGDRAAGLDCVRILDEVRPRPPIVALVSEMELELLALLVEGLRVEAVLRQPVSTRELSVRLDELLGLDPSAPRAQVQQASATAVDELFLALRRGARLTMLERVNALDAALTQLLDDPRDQRLDDAIWLAHNLVGSAGVYSARSVAAAAARIEELLRRYQGEVTRVCECREAVQGVLLEARAAIEESAG